MAFARLTYRESLRDIEACLGAMGSKRYHAGIRGPVRRSTLADANENRDWRIYADFAQVLIAAARKLYAQDEFGVALKQTTYALDSTTIDLCLALFPWARFRRRKGAVSKRPYYRIYKHLHRQGRIGPCRCRCLRTTDVKVGKLHQVNHRPPTYHNLMLGQ